MNWFINVLIVLGLLVIDLFKPSDPQVEVCSQNKSPQRSLAPSTLWTVSVDRLCGGASVRFSAALRISKIRLKDLPFQPPILMIYFICTF